MGVPGFQPDASSPSIGRIITSTSVGAVVSSNARNLPLGCHDGWLLRVPALREALRLARPIGALPVQVRRRRCPRGPMRTRCGGRRGSTPASWSRSGSDVRRVSVSRAHS